MRFWSSLAAAVAAVLLAAPGAWALAPTTTAAVPVRSDPEAIAPDPDVLRGVLPNGLRYAVMRNGHPAGGASIRLVVGAGSFMEAPAERGAAHFVEHLAFQTGEPAIDYIGAFQAAGVTFGRDQNAETDLFDTDYKLDLPKAEPATLDLAFAWLRGVADGAPFAEEGIEREKGVLVAERNLRLTPAQREADRNLAFRGPGLKSSSAAQIEPVESIRGMTRAALTAFYDRWYRPSNAVVVMVGDLPPQEMRQRIERAFGGWVARGPEPARPALGAPPAGGAPQVQATTDPNGLATLRICMTGKADPRPINDVPQLERKMAPYAWAFVLNHRFQRLVSTTNPPFTSAAATYSDEGREAGYACVAVVPLGDDWRRALEATEAELRRFAAYGASDAEARAAVREVRDALLSGALRYGERDSKTMADELADSDLRGEVYPSPTEAWRAMDRVIERLDGKALKAAFAQAWNGSGPYITFASAAPPSDETLRTAWTAAAARPAPAAGPDATPIAWAYSNFGAPGRVVKRQRLANPDRERITFANGVVLNLMRTSFDPDKAEVRVRFGAGRREVANGDFNIAVFGGQMLPGGGLGRHDLETVRSLFAGKSWSISLDMSETAFVLSGRTSPWDLDAELQLLAAFCEDPGFRPEIDARLPTVIAYGYQSFRTAPASAMLQALLDQLWPASPTRLPPEDVARRWRTADFARVLRRPLTSDPLEVTVVGAVDEDTAVNLVAATFGALKPRQPAPRPRDDAWFMRFPEAGHAPVTTTVEGASTGAVGAIWPLYVATPERRREEYALELASRVFSDALRVRVRQTLGKSYTPAVQVQMPDKGDQGMMLAFVDTAPADADEVRGEVLAAAKRLAAGEITPSALDQARRPIIADFTQRTVTNAFWADALSAERDYPQVLDEARTASDVVGSISLDEVRAAAARWLSRPPLMVTAVPAAAR